MSQTAEKVASDNKRPKQGRSPAYPSVDMQVALAKAQALYDAEGKYAVPMTSAFKAWGFGMKSSGGRLLRAALRYFGLVLFEGEGDQGKVKLTDDALRILLDTREDQTEKKALIRKLSLLPSIHKKLFDKFPEGIKSDGTAEHYLIFEERYNKTAASEIVAEFKATATFAGLFQPDNVMDKLDELDENDSSTDMRRDGNQPQLPPAAKGKVKLMEGERIVFTEESNPQVYVKLVASGELDALLLEALDEYVKRQRKRLNVPAPVEQSAA